MSQNIPNIHILWAFIWLNELRLKASGCIICSTIYFPTEIYLHYVADCIARKHIFHVFDRKIKSRAVRKPLPSHQERCLAPRNRYAASLRPEIVTILQRAMCIICSIGLKHNLHMDNFVCAASQWETYIVMPSLIGWALTKKYLCLQILKLCIVSVWPQSWSIDDGL